MKGARVCPPTSPHGSFSSTSLAPAAQSLPLRPQLPRVRGSCHDSPFHQMAPDPGVQQNHFLPWPLQSQRWLRLPALLIPDLPHFTLWLLHSLITRVTNKFTLFKNTQVGASLVAQWLRICLPMQGTRVRALVWEDPTCRGATRPASHSY